jgi:hypothetical protein
MSAAIIRCVFLVLCMAVLTHSSMAIPAFARKYNMSCTTCHSPFPRLKTYGDEFAGNGFKLPGQEPARYTRETGDDQLQLLRELPLALRFEGYARWQPQTAGRSDLQTPYLLKILSGGSITRDVSYYFYFFFSERGEVAGIEDAFIIFNDLFGTDLDVYVGQYQISDPLFKRELRLMLEDYQIYRAKPGTSGINLTYDRGVMLTYGLPTHTNITVELLNGSGIGPADAARNFDTDKYKNGLIRISQDVVKGVRVGGFGYYGKEAQGGIVNTMWMAGPDLSLTFEPVELNVQYLERRDDDPWFAFATKKTTTRGGFGEMIYFPEGDRSTWYAAALYNWLEIPGSTRYQSATGHFGYMLARNFRLIGEYTYDFEAKGNKFTIGFISAF